MLLHDASESIRWQVGDRGARALRRYASVRNTRTSCNGRCDLLGLTRRGLSLLQSHGHPHCGRVSQLFHDDALNAFRSRQVHKTIIKAIQQDVLVPCAAPHLQRIVKESFRRGTVLGSSDAAVHGIAERSCRGDIDVVETKAQFALSLGPASQKVDSIVPSLADCLLNTEFAIRRLVERAWARSLSMYVECSRYDEPPMQVTVPDVCNGWQWLLAGCEALSRVPTRVHCPRSGGE